MNSDRSIRTLLRRLKPEKMLHQLRPRNPRELRFVAQLQRPFPELVLDTTVYIDDWQGRLPGDVETCLQLTTVWHSTVTEAELAAVAGLLDPRHPKTRQAVQEAIISVERRPNHRILNPDREVWREAGILAGLLAPLQHYGKGEQRRALNDALILLSAAKHGYAVLTRNIVDFDLLTQLAPFATAIFYDQGK